MEKWFGESKRVGRETSCCVVTLSLIQAKGAGGSDEGGSDRSGDKWLEYMLKMELIGLADIFEQRMKEREEPRKAPRVLVEPWLDAGCHLSSGETQRRVGQRYSRLSSSEFPWEGQVLSSASAESSWVSKTSIASHWESAWEKVSLKMRPGEKQRSLMCSLKSCIQPMPKVCPTCLSILYQGQ